MRILLCFVLLAFSGQAMAQKQLSLENLDDFKPQAGNWRIVGGVEINRNVDIHHKPAPLVEIKKKKKKTAPVVEPPKAVTYTAGTGILLNMNDDGAKDHIITNWEHGDIELEFDVMMPKGSNSGVYLQGRYEVQLLDSWKVKSPSFSDIGGIYRNWEKEPSKMLYGIPPSVNAAKAPGLWQHFDIKFIAPRFDANGKKTANARFVSVKLNGVLIHTNVEVALPTGGPIAFDEVAQGPIMIQGDHGPVAIRNFKYTLLEDSKAAIKDITYKTYKGEFKGIEEFVDSKPVSEGSQKQLDISVVQEDDNYGAIFSGTLEIDETDDYTLTLGHKGGAKLIIDDEVVFQNLEYSANSKLNKEVRLEKGSHSFTIFNFKSAPWHAPALGFFIKQKTSHRKALHFYESYPELSSLPSQINVDVSNKVRTIRAFVDFKGEKPRMSHTICVGLPEGVNFVYDLSTANLLGAWRGDFLDATPMWHNRGNATVKPKGAVQWTALNQPLAQLTSLDSPFPDKASENDFRQKGYEVNRDNNTPTFKHEYKGVEITNKLTSDASGTYLLHELNFSQQNLSGWYYRLAAGEIARMADGSYAINGQQYYVNMVTSQTPVMREVDGEQELVIPVDGSDVKYEFIW